MEGGERIKMGKLSGVESGEPQLSSYSYSYSYFPPLVGGYNIFRLLSFNALFTSRTGPSPPNWQLDAKLRRLATMAG